MTTPNFRNDRVSLLWRRDGADWLLLADRRRMGRVVPDSRLAGMWRSIKSRGRLSDMANLSWSKNAVLTAAERDLAFEDRQRRATDPQKCPVNGGVFRPESLPVRKNGSAARRERNALPTHPGPAS
jgi:hypothetical protein